MTPEVLSCPYCNTRFTLPSQEAATARVHCPRCGDSFPHKGVTESMAEPPIPRGPLPEAGLILRLIRWLDRFPQGGHPNWHVARLFLGIMAGMAALALVYALMTVQFRRDNDRKKVPPGTQDVVINRPSAMRPVDLAGLGYLPADSGLVAGLHLAELLQDDDGKKLWQQVRQGPANRLLKLVEDTTGLKAEQIDHLVVGLSSAAGQPRLVLVLRTRSPYPPEALAKALTPAKVERSQARLIYRFSAGAFAEGLVFQAAEDTLIMSLGFLGARVDDLQAIPTKPRQGSDGLPLAIQKTLAERVNPASLLWLVASMKDLPWLADLGNLGILPEKARATLAQLNAFGAGIRFQGGVALDGALQGKDEKAARALAALLLKKQPTGVESYTVVPPPPAAEAKESKRRHLGAAASPCQPRGTTGFH